MPVRSEEMKREVRELGKEGSNKGNRTGNIQQFILTVIVREE